MIPVVGVNTTLADRYHLEALVGQGGMADVYRACDLVLERTVAIKVVRGAGEDDARRFAREVRTMAALSHPAIVQLFDAGTHEGAPYLVMELIDGDDLPSVLAQGPMDTTHAAALGRQLSRALAHAHDLGVVHRDVKPANVLVDRDGRSRLSDFGIARLADTTRVTTPGMTSGTAGYLAPEQLGADDVGPPADVYALGLVLLEALTGSKEFTGTPMEAAMARLHRDPAVPDDLPAPWPTLLRSMTARDPEQRPTAAQVTARLSVTSPAAPSGATAGEQTVVLPQQQDAAAPAEREARTTRISPKGRAVASPKRRAIASPKRRAIVGTVALLAVAGALGLSGLSNPNGEVVQDPAPPAEESILPGDLDDAIRRLEEVVRP